MRLRYPDFVCIGAQKCGTTWLYENLKNQSGIALPVVKELHYFNEIWLPFQRQWTPAHRRKQVLDHIEWYLNNVPRSAWDASYLNSAMHISERPICDHWYGAIFGNLPEHAIVGEMTPEYALLPLAGIQHILRLNEQLKFIFVVRDPIERAWSQLKMIVRNEGHEPSIDTYRRILRYRDIKMRSNYFETIERMQQAGAGERLFWTSIDTIKADPQLVLHQICEFIGIAGTTLNLDRAGDVIHEGASGEIPADLVEPMWAQLADCYNLFENVAPDLVCQWRERHKSAA